MIQPGTVLYASTDTPEAITEARAYIAEQGLTQDDCRLIRVEGQIRVMAKKLPDGWRK